MVDILRYSTMSIINTNNLPSVASLLAIQTKEFMARDNGHYQYPNIIKKKARNIEDGIRRYKKHIRNGYVLEKPTGYNPFTRTMGFKNIVDMSASAKGKMLQYGGVGYYGINALKERIFKQQKIIIKYNKVLDKLFKWRKDINLSKSGQFSKTQANQLKKDFKKEVLTFLLFISYWNERNENKRLQFMRPDVTTANGRMRTQDKIIDNLELHLNMEYRQMERNLEEYVHLIHIKKQVEKIENGFLNARYNPKTKIGYKFVNDLYDENF